MRMQNPNHVQTDSPLRGEGPSESFHRSQDALLLLRNWISNCCMLAAGHELQEEQGDLNPHSPFTIKVDTMVTSGYFTGIRMPIVNATLSLWVI